jgi:hypothetical protein
MQGRVSALPAILVRSFAMARVARGLKELFLIGDHTGGKAVGPHIPAARAFGIAIIRRRPPRVHLYSGAAGACVDRRRSRVALV